MSHNRLALFDGPALGPAFRPLDEPRETARHGTEEVRRIARRLRPPTTAAGSHQGHCHPRAASEACGSGPC
jgi:signal transduction histidine kinase